MSTVATRLITLILSLQRQPGQKAADLASRLGVSVRTLHRYFGMLDEMGVPVYAERGPYGGFSLVRGYKLPPLVFTPEEAVAVSLGTSLVGEMWGTLYHESAEGALAKLENVLPDEQRQEIAWARRALVATGMNRADIQALAPSLEKLRRAVRENRRVSMIYHSGSNPHGEQRDLDPYALVHRSGWWYVVGYCHRRSALRTFRVDRIAGLSLTDQIFPAPVDFNIHSYMAQEWQDAPQLKVRMGFAAQFAHLAQYARGYWETLEEQPDGSVVVTFNAPDVYAAASNTLAYGPAVTVLEPPEVRQMVQEWAQQTVSLYE
ncbi:MAG: transcriptional regulator [Chloroflexi bacterium HGW-Chloroflexi-6]|nr:MAG: transcriptional regulator [Chloroflexi bacterium HGW-Chloroflexi-6]